MSQKINRVDICCGLNWGDEGKGKVVSHLASTGIYDFVCRWAGGCNAGHTIYKDGKRYKTHLIPSGIIHGIKSVIGPDCVINKESFQRELEYLAENGFDTSLIKISPRTHVILDSHICEDREKYQKQGTTKNGIAPCYGDKYARKGTLVKDIEYFKDFLWDGKLYGNVLCEGAQGFWLDINQGNYPYTTSSTTLPYGSCSLGFPPRLIRNIYGACKIYDTRVGTDPDFPETLLDDEDLKKIIEVGKEYGTTTGRIRKTQWLNLDKLILAINISGTTDIIISKVDVLEKVGKFKYIVDDRILACNSMEEMKKTISTKLKKECCFLNNIIYSGDLEVIDLIVPTNTKLPTTRIEL